MKKYLVILLALMLVFAAACSAPASQHSKDYNDGYEAGYRAGWDDAEMNAELFSDSSRTENTPQESAEPSKTPVGGGRTVYWVPNGEKYHKSSSCRTLSRSSNILSGTVEDALSAGKDSPCKVCY